MSHQSLFHGSISPSGTPSQLRSLTVAGTALFLALASQSAFAATAPTVSLTRSNQTINAGVVETLTATVTSTTGRGSNKVTVNVAPGLVSFYDNAGAQVPTLLGTAALNSSGVGSIKLKLGTGSHSIKAIFAATTSYLSASSASESVSVRATGSYTDTGVLSQTDATHLLYTGTFYGQSTPGGTVSFTDLTANNGHGGAIGSGVDVTSSMMSPTFNASGTVTGSPATLGAMQTATGDFNKDGIPDIAIANSSDNSVSILIGNGDGTFKAQVPYTTAYGSYGVVVGDFNADGYQDLAVANMSAGTVSVLINKGASAPGTFNTHVDYTVGTTSNPTPYGLTVADINNDGVQDLVVANYVESSVSVLLGQTNTTGSARGLASGTFAAAVTTNVGSGNGHQGAYAVVVADIDEDGNQDIIVPLAYDGTVEVLFGTGAATFPTPVVVSPGTGNTGTAGPIPYAIALGDFNGDGHIDAAVVNAGTSNVLILQNVATSGPSAHARTLSEYSTFPVGSLPTSIALLQNYDGQNHDSLAVTNNSDKTITILSGNGALNFTRTTLPAAAASYYSLSVADFNGDGKSDLVVANFGGNSVGVQLGAQTALVPLTHSLTSGHSIRARYSNGNNDAYADSANSNTIVAQ